MPAPTFEELGVQFTNSPDGTMEVTLPTGQVYRGNKDEVLAEALKSQIHASRTIKEMKEQQQSVAAPPPPPPPQPTSTLDPQTENLGVYIWDTLAQTAHKVPHNPLVAGFARHDSSLSEMAVQNVDLQFQAKFPDFPNTAQAGEAILSKVQDEFGLDPNQIDQLCMVNPKQAMACMAAAHRACIAEGIYQPLTREQQLATSDAEALAALRGNRPTPPPMAPSGNPENGAGEYNPWAEKLDDLRNRAIRQQLEGK